MVYGTRGKTGALRPPKSRDEYHEEEARRLAEQHRIQKEQNKRKRDDQQRVDSVSDDVEMSDDEEGPPQKMRPGETGESAAQNASAAVATTAHTSPVAVAAPVEALPSQATALPAGFNNNNSDEAQLNDKEQKDDEATMGETGKATEKTAPVSFQASAPVSVQASPSQATASLSSSDTANQRNDEEEKDEEASLGEPGGGETDATPVDVAAPVEASPSQTTASPADSINTEAQLNEEEDNDGAVSICEAAGGGTGVATVQASQVAALAQAVDADTVCTVAPPEGLKVSVKQFQKFVNLPNQHEHMRSVDVIHGLWYICSLCDDKKVKVRFDRPFSDTRWKDHVKSETHSRREAEKDSLSAIRAKKKAGKKLSKLEAARLRGHKKPPHSMRFFCKPAALCVGPNSSTSASTRAISLSSGTKASPKTNSCEGVFPDYQNRELQKNFVAYSIFAAVDESSEYTFGLGASSMTNLFSKKCSKQGILRKTRLGTIHACNHCHDDFYCVDRKATSVKKNIKRRGNNFINMQLFVRRNEVSNEDIAAMESLCKLQDKFLSNPRGVTLKANTIQAVRFFKGLKNERDDVKALVQGSSKFIPGIDTFLLNFMKFYLTDKKMQNSLLTHLMKAYIAKLNGDHNPVYSTMVTDFFLSLASTGSKAVVELVSSNLGRSVSMRHLKRIQAKKRSAPFINLTRDEIANIVTKRIDRIRGKLGSRDSRVSITLGVDATALIPAYQICHSHGVIVGGAAPNHYISLEGLEKDGVAKLLKECLDGEHGQLASEIKVVVLTFQQTPPGMSPYLVLVGRPQSKNENTDWVTEVNAAIQVATDRDINSVLLNEAKDGVSCDVEDNKILNLNYLRGTGHVLGLTDTKHNNKNCRGQLISGTSPSSLGRFVVDPFHLKLAKVAKELWRIEDWASDVVVLRLCSPRTLLKLIGEGFDDTGNLSLLVVSLTFIRLRNYAVNVNGLSWKDRCVYSWCSLLWFTSFHTPYSTMLPNKRNMLLETIACLFLFPRDDVHRGGLLTDEANEHTYGMWRMMQREFNVEQCIRIVQKNIIKLNAIYESGLSTSRSNSLKGYQASIASFIENTREGSTSCGPVNVELDEQPVGQIWPEVKSIINFSYDIMKPFLKVFGSEEGNGVSPFAVNINSPEELADLVEEFFKRPKPDKRGQRESASAEQDDNGDSGPNTDDDDSGDRTAVTSLPTDPTQLEGQIDAIRRAEQAGDGDDIEDIEDIDSNITPEENDSSPPSPAAPPLSKSDKSSETYDQFKKLIRSGTLNDIILESSKLMALLTITDSDKSGAITMDAKFMSRSQRWFNQKADKGGVSATKEPEKDEEDLFLRRNSLIDLRCKVQGREQILHYRALAFFTKYYNKWFPSIEDEFRWVNDSSKKPNAMVLARLVEKSGSAYQEVQLHKDGEWGPHHVFRTVQFNDIVRVGNELVDL